MNKNKKLFEASLIYKCPECEKTEIGIGYEEIHQLLESQIASETRKIYCPKCLRKM